MKKTLYAFVVMIVLTVVVKAQTPTLDQVLGSGNISSLGVSLGGNVGIGTATPSAPLQISQTNTATSGTINGGLMVTPTYNQASGTATNTDLFINRTETAVGSGLQYLLNAQVGGVSKFNVLTNGNFTGGTAFITAIANSSSSNNALISVNTTGTFISRNVADASDAFTVTNASTSNTGFIQRWVFGSSSVAILTSSGAFFGQGVSNLSSKNNAQILTAILGTSISRNIADANAALVVNNANATSTGDILDLQAGGTTKIAFGQNGNVGIGTTTPGYKLDIIGTTHTSGNLYADHKVIIGTGIVSDTPGAYGLYVEKGILTSDLKVALTTDSVNWSDFVFNKDYDLMPLDKVASFIDANKHLPNIPTAEEVRKDGVNVVGMDAKLLQKIEELTLYTIRLSKTIEEQDKNLEAQQKYTQQLKKEIEELNSGIQHLKKQRPNTKGL